jgi:hypothetical protein
VAHPAVERVGQRRGLLELVVDVVFQRRDVLDRLQVVAVQQAGVRVLEPGVTAREGRADARRRRGR